MSNATHDEPGVPLGIPLSEIPESTKDFLLAMSALGKPVTEVIVATLDEAAAKQRPRPQAA
jgi:hypothetical protein